MVRDTTQKEPPKIEHQWWRHKKAGYEVEVLGVYNYGPPPYRRTVVVDRSRCAKKKRTWPAELFVATFEPLGEAIERKTLWEQL